MPKEPIDQMRPWTVKSVASRVIEEIAAGARRENLTVGQLVERIWDEHTGRDSPEPARDVTPDLTSLLHAAADFAAVDSLPREVRALINGMARRARLAGAPGTQLDAPPADHQPPRLPESSPG